MGFQSAQNAQLASKTGLLPKQVNQKHIFDCSQTLGGKQGPKRAKISLKGGQNIKQHIMKPNGISKCPKLILYLDKLAKSIFSITVRLLGAQMGQERGKISPQKGPKHKIAFYEPKWDFKVPKTHRWPVKLVFYINELARSICMTVVRLQEPYKGQKRAKIYSKGVQNTKSHIMKPNRISKHPKFIVEQ